MKSNPLTHLLLAIFVAIGLFVSPLPVAAGGYMDDSAQMMDMTNAMPGCPSPMVPDECHKCPLMVVCLIKSVAAVPDSALGAPVAFGQPLGIKPGHDRLLAGLGFSPPARPPRTSVIPA